MRERQRKAPAYAGACESYSLDALLGDAHRDLEVTERLRGHAGDHQDQTQDLTVSAGDVEVPRRSAKQDGHAHVPCHRRTTGIQRPWGIPLHLLLRSG